MSSSHAVIEPDDQGAWMVRDLGSRNGTFVDRKRVQAASPRDETVLRLGDTVLLLMPAAPAVEEDAVLIGCSAGFLRSLAALRDVASSDMPVLLEGETGVGKEVFARRLHELRGEPGRLVPVNCGSIPTSLVASSFFGRTEGAFTGAHGSSEGFFGAARGGTLLLDEVGELPLQDQPALLRVLEDGQYTPVGTTRVVGSDARIVAATNCDLQAEVVAGTFRADLYARLAGYRIRLPPLRRRRADIPLLAEHFLAEFDPDRSFDVSAGFVEALLLYEWPYNVRELRFVVRRLALLRPAPATFHTHHLAQALQASSDESPPQRPASPVDSGTASPRSGRPSRSELAEVLTRFRGNVTRVAHHYEKNTRQVYRWVEAYDLSLEDYRHRAGPGPG